MNATNVIRSTALAAVLLLAASPVPAPAAQGDCGIPFSTSGGPFTTDCLIILRASVQLEECALCICDTGGSGQVTASDAQLCLRKAVGQNLVFSCPPCDTTTTTLPPETTTTLPPETTTTTVVIDTTTTSLPPDTTTTLPPDTTTTLPPETTTTQAPDTTTTLPPDTTTTTLEETTTTTVPVPGGVCPAFAEWRTDSGYGAPCDVDGDCASGACDALKGRCRTVSELDLGWTGTAHDADLNDESRLRVLLDCPGGADGGDCGTCEVAGLDPSNRSCRCANDTRNICDEPQVQDKDDCPTCFGGAFVGFTCAVDADCQGGPCTRRCTNDRSIVCTSNGQCPGGTCDTTIRCSTGKTCNFESECTGTCTAGALCQCFEGAPQPMVAGGVALCVVPRFSSDVSGSVNVDTGASSLHRDVRAVVYNGLSLQAPCPWCGGRCSNDAGQTCAFDADCGGGNTCLTDPVPRDGVRGGVCIGGVAGGQSCDVDVVNPSFPTSTSGLRGGGHSLDCMPNSGTNISGGGLKLAFAESTASTAPLPGLPCAPAAPGGACLCRVCSGDATVACDSDADCAAVGGTCSAVGTNGVEPLPNACEGLACTTTGGEGACTTGPDDRFCDEVLQSDGRGVYSCASNTDCQPGTAGIDAGLCTVETRRNCFGDSLAATGDADPTRPVTVAVFCVPPLNVALRNQSLGLPGPARIKRQNVLRSFCASDPGQRYTPGVGGCQP